MCSKLQTEKIFVIKRWGLFSRVCRHGDIFQLTIMNILCMETQENKTLEKGIHQSNSKNEEFKMYLFFVFNFNFPQNSVVADMTNS